MTVALIDLAFALVVAAVGGIAGWWLRGAGPAAPAPRDAEEGRAAREILGRLHELARGMAANVGAHSSRVQEINQELTAADSGKPEEVVSAVAKLINANQKMQQQLSTAEDKLQEQTRLVESHAAAARTDALTGLANRRALDDELARRFAEFQRYGKKFSIIMGDVDHFKRFNDTHGHQAGDEVLRGVARVFRENAREVDIVARYGGEEFAVILPETSVAEARPAMARVRRAIEAACFHFQSAELHVTVSFGVAEVQAGEEAAATVRRADAALYAAKQAGRNRGHWHDGREIHPILEGPAASPPREKAEKASPVKEQKPAQPTAAPRAEGPAEREPHAGPRSLCTRTEFRSYLERRVAEWRRGGSPPAVLLVRVDGFDKITDRQGSQAAALVLRATSQFLAAAIRDMDLAGDFGKGTFAVLLPGAALGGAIGVAERLRQAIAHCVLPVPGGPMRFSVSVGGAVTLKGDETDTLLERTEEALQAATQSAGNCTFFHNGQRAETVAAALERAR